MFEIQYAWLVLSLLLSAFASEQRLHIALHAQLSFASSGRVVGSEITCAGFSRAMESRGHHVQMFYPFEYANISSQKWDLVFIEGWFEMAHAFLHEMRRVSPSVVIFFFCLDPDMPGLSQVVRPAKILFACVHVYACDQKLLSNNFQVASMDVDAFFTNSIRSQKYLRAAGAHVE